ncbi:MAG: AsmA family protein [Pseudomonadota bacterium]
MANISKSKKMVVAALIVLSVIILAVIFFNWNLLRRPIGNYISDKLDRNFAINGDLHVHLSNPIVVDAEQITLANARWATEPLMAKVERLVLKIDLWKIFSGDVVLPEISLVKPWLLLEKNATGDANWTFRETASKDGPGPVIGILKIDDGTTRYRDPALSADVTIKLNSVNKTDAEQRANIRFTGDGKFRNEPVHIEGSGATLLALREAGRPYEMEIRARAGKTNATFNGQFIPAQLKSINGYVELQGDDLSKLYPIIPLPLPWTPPYKIAGGINYKSGVWSVEKMAGRIGNSDISGEASVDQNSDPYFITANLVSHRLNYKDLGGLVGVPPGGGEQAANMSQEQKKESARRAASTKVLSDKPYHFEQLRKVNAEVRFRGERIVADDLPIENLDAKIYLKDGQLKLQPFNFGIGGGSVSTNAVIDARKSTMTADTQLHVKNVELSAILPQLKPPKGAAGKLAGKAHLSFTGNSVAQLLASMHGGLTLIEWGGNASTLTLVLTNIDLARAAELLLRGDDTSQIRCVVADFGANKGLMTANTLIMDTTAVNVVGEGSVDFGSEIYDLRLRAKSKRASALALKGPIRIGGTFKNPNVGPEVGPVAGRVAAALTLGALATPLAAILPLIDLGGGKDSDCRALIDDANSGTGPNTIKSASKIERRNGKQ